MTSANIAKPLSPFFDDARRRGHLTPVGLAYSGRLPLLSSWIFRFLLLGWLRPTFGLPGRSWTDWSPRMQPENARGHSSQATSKIGAITGARVLGSAR